MRSFFLISGMQVWISIGKSLEIIFHSYKFKYKILNMQKNDLIRFKIIHDALVS